ncbi:MAG: hypothetical protein ACOYMW_09215 [Candidatus Competibacteraceae bacterium]
MTDFSQFFRILGFENAGEDRSETEILNFQWFPNKDTPEDLIDRLQRLYKRGMKDSLGEDITYFGERDIASLLIPSSFQVEQQTLLETITVHETKQREAEVILSAAANKKRQILLDGIK